MCDLETKKYKALNELAEQGGIVIFGGAEDSVIPIGELKQAFAVEENIYNRSIRGLSIERAVTMYDAYAAALAPKTVLLHLGDADFDFFKEKPFEFDRKYGELITHIRSQSKNCRIVVVSLRNYENDPTIAELNKHLKYIADSNRCEYGDIANRRVWNPRSTKESMSFIYSIGFVRPLKMERPVYDLVKIFFALPT